MLQIHSIDPEYIYLVKIVPRQNLFQLCSKNNMQALWYFIRQNCVSRKNRIIPNLEYVVYIISYLFLNTFNCFLFLENGFQAVERT